MGIITKGFMEKLAFEMVLEGLSAVLQHTLSQEYALLWLTIIYLIKNNNQISNLPIIVTIKCNLFFPVEKWLFCLSVSSRKTFKVDDMLSKVEKMKGEQESHR